MKQASFQFFENGEWAFEGGAAGEPAGEMGKAAEALVETTAETAAQAVVEAVAEPVAEAAGEQGPAAPVARRREREITAARLELRPAGVLVRRVGHKGVSVTACDVDSAMILLAFRKGGLKAVRPEVGIEQWEDNRVVVPRMLRMRETHKAEENCFTPVKVYFDIRGAVAPSFGESAVGQFLEILGLSAACPPSLERWIPREYRKQVRENTSLLLPEVVDTRSLYERLEDGMRVRCIKTSPGFAVGNIYVVGQKEPTNGEEGFALLHRALGGGSTSNQPQRWSETVDMEEYFELETPQSVIYKPEECIPNVYKREFEAFKREVEAKVASGEWELFEHTVYDASQAALLSSYFNGKIMRSGKTRETIVWHKLRRHKKVGYFCQLNGAAGVMKELAILHIADCRQVRSYKDLEEPQTWMEVISYSWMKSAKDTFDGMGFAPVKNCPRCQQPLWRKVLADAGQACDQRGMLWVQHNGYLCRNRDCRKTDFLRDRAPGVMLRNRQRKLAELPVGRRGGAEWFLAMPPETEIREHGAGYVDLGRKAHMAHVKKDLTHEGFHGRLCRICGYVKDTWVPAPARRLRKRYDSATFDELHNCKDIKAMITQRTTSIHVREVCGMTGTLMPNAPSDAFWPLLRTFGNDTFRFPYGYTGSAPREGQLQFDRDFTDTVLIENVKTGTHYKKAIPYMKNPVKFWRMMAPKMIRRTFEDPMMRESLRKAGLCVPRYEVRHVMVKPDPLQAALMLGSMQDFDEHFREYQNSLVVEGTGQAQLLNRARVISQMMRLRLGATCPDYINERLTEAGLPPLYLGPKGGAKMEQVFNLTQNKCLKGEKVLILSDFRCMQKILMEELAIFRPILFNTSWDGTRRQEAFDAFNEDPDRQVFIAGPRAIAESVDLAGGPDNKCRTVISTDLLWNPGRQIQSWHRILKPARDEYAADIFILMLEASVDRHVYNTFYAKLFAAEQALDRKVVSKVKAFDIGGFVEQVLADREKMLEYLQAVGEEEVYYLPYIEAFGRLQNEEREL